MKTISLFFSFLFFCMVSKAQFEFSQSEKRNNKNSDASLTPKSIRISDEVELEYVEKGNGNDKTIIFLHGYSDSWHSFEKVIGIFPGNVHLVAVSQRGHGNSSKPTSGYHPRDLARDIAQFIGEKKLGACIIAGHSMGGMVAQQFAIDYPALTKAVILIDTDPHFAANPGFPEFLQEILAFDQPAGYDFARDFQVSTLSSPIDSAELELYISESLKLPLHVWKGIAASMMEADLTPGLKNIHAPVLIFWGSKDNFCAMSDQEIFMINLPKRELHIYEGTGHGLHWQEPERFVADICDFLKKL